MSRLTFALALAATVVLICGIGVIVRANLYGRGPDGAAEAALGFMVSVVALLIALPMWIIWGLLR